MLLHWFTWSLQLNNADQSGAEWVSFSDVTGLALAMCSALTWLRGGRETEGYMRREEAGEKRERVTRL